MCQRGGRRDEEMVLYSEKAGIMAKPLLRSMDRTYHANAFAAMSSKEELLERDMCKRPEGVGIREKSPLRVIGLADSANAFSAISNMQPKSVGKLAKISLAFLRDISSEAHMSLIDPPIT